jgi:hypothetical protein
MARPFEADVPVPIGFWFVESASEDQATALGRLYLRHVYEGAAPRPAVRAFYREHMPLARWSMVSSGHVHGEYTLRFEKNDESCTVLIREGQRRGATTRVQVIIARQQSGTAARAAGSES